MWVPDYIISYCNQYVYLGSPFPDDGSPSTAIKLHGNNKMCHVLKFISFVNRNNDIPFVVKKKVFDAAVTSSLLYACESWMNGNIKPIEKQYNWCIKQLLGVRKTTNNNACMVELGLPPLRALIEAKQRTFSSQTRQHFFGRGQRFGSAVKYLAPDLIVAIEELGVKVLAR